MRYLWLLAVATAAVLCGCGGDDEVIPVDQFLGTWTAAHMTYTKDGDAATVVDVVTTLGGTVTLTFSEGGTYLLVEQIPGEDAFTQSGAWSKSIDTLTMTPQGMPFSIVFDMAYSGTTLVLAGGSAEYDFDGNDTPEGARLDLVLTKS